MRCNIILVDFSLAVSTLTAKPPNLIPPPIFQLYVYSILYTYVLPCVEIVIVLSVHVHTSIYMHVLIIITERQFKLNEHEDLERMEMTG